MRISDWSSDVCSSDLIVGAIVIGIVGILAASALGFAQALAAELGSVAAMLVRIATWLGAALPCHATIAAMSRFVPAPADPDSTSLQGGIVCATADSAIHARPPRILPPRPWDHKPPP